MKLSRYKTSQSKLKCMVSSEKVSVLKRPQNIQSQHPGKAQSKDPWLPGFGAGRGTKAGTQAFEVSTVLVQPYSTTGQSASAQPQSNTEGCSWREGQAMGAEAVWLPGHGPQPQNHPDSAHQQGCGDLCVLPQFCGEPKTALKKIFIKVSASHPVHGATSQVESC